MCSLTSVVLLSASATTAQSAITPPVVHDAYATESTANWNHRHVRDLTASDDAKVGKCSIVGTFQFTWHISLSVSKALPWNLTRHDKLHFWAKAVPDNQNLLVMLCTNGFKNRRDAVVALTSEWQLYELPFDETTFHRNVQGRADFASVRSIVFYNNSPQATRIWLDGVELAGSRRGTAPEDPVAAATNDPEAKTIEFRHEDPTPHLEEAKAARHDVRPRYDLSPVAFNRENAFEDALVSFDQARGWQAILREADGRLCLSRDQTLRGVPSLKIEISPAGKQPRIMLVPPEPIAINHSFDVIEAWIYGHRHGGKMALQFRLRDGTLLAVGNGHADTTDAVAFKPIGQFWTLARILVPEAIPAGAELTAIVLSPKLSDAFKDEPYLFHLDQLRVFRFSEYLKQPAPELKNVGKVVDNFPVHEDGACPRSTEPVETSVEKVGDSYHFAYTTSSGSGLRYSYTPKTGTLADLSIRPGDEPPFRPADGSGPLFDFDGQMLDATQNASSAELVACELKGQSVVAAWRYTGARGTQTVTYELGLKGKTLRIAVRSDQRCVTKWLFGRATGVRDARVIEVPFMLYSPNVLYTHDLFVTYYTEWYRSNASMFPYGSQCWVKGDDAGYSWRDDPRPQRGYRYRKRTDGSRHPLREVFYITASHNFDDVMLTVSNPPSPMKHILKKRLYRMVLASAPGVFKRARAFVDLCDDYGMTDFYFLFHAPLWFRRRAGSEAFPGDMTVSMLHEPEGGDEGLKALFKHMREKGIFPGYYDGYPARDVTAASFRYDWTTYGPSGAWKRMWRCPALKPWAFPELASTLYRARTKKFGARVSYQDGITSHIITYMNDYDHRYPKSGLLRETMRALATGWQRARENVNGPVFSEGRGSDFYTAGLNDGDYSKLKGYWDDKPCTEDRVQLLVDFRLKKLGPLSAPVSLNIGYAGFAATNKIHYESWYASTDYAHLHHFLAAQIAFAAIGMLEPYWPIWDDPKLHFDQTMRCYFLMRQLQERYIMEEVADTRYFDGEALLPTSDALRADIVKDNRVYIRYANGLTLYINANWDGKHWPVTDRGETCDLPPGGWYARQGDDFVAFAIVRDGERIDFVDSPEYVYLDGHGRSVEIAGHRTDRQLVKWKTGRHVGETLTFPDG